MVLIEEMDASCARLDPGNIAQGQVTENRDYPTWFRPSSAPEQLRHPHQYPKGAHHRQSVCCKNKPSSYIESPGVEMQRAGISNDFLY